MSELEEVKEIKEVKSEIISRNKLLEAGVYFGHKKDLWNPKMKPYIAAVRKGVHIIDLEKTKKALDFAYKLIQFFAKKGGSFIFVGTKKQAKEIIRQNALRANSHYVSERWLGGTLTNSRTIFQRVRRMETIERLAEKNYEGYTKKEGLIFAKELSKLQKNLTGIRNMKQKPNVMIVADVKADLIALQEAKKLGIKIISLVDSDDDPTLADLAIPANNDSVKSLTLLLTILADAIVDFKGGEPLFAYQPDEKIVLPEEKKKERIVKKFFNKRFFPRKQDRNFVKENYRDKKVVKIDSNKKTLGQETNLTANNFTQIISPEKKDTKFSQKTHLNTEDKKPEPSKDSKIVKEETLVSSPKNSEANHDDYSSMNVIELKTLLKKKGMSTTGNKLELIARLQGK